VAPRFLEYLCAPDIYTWAMCEMNWYLSASNLWLESTLCVPECVTYHWHVHSIWKAADPGLQYVGCSFGTVVL